MSGEGNGAFDIKFLISWLFAAGILYPLRKGLVGKGKVLTIYLFRSDKISANPSRRFAPCAQ